MARVYLDYNATTPVRSAAVDAMLAVLRDDFGNPSSVHWAGAAAREHVDRARRQVADLLGADPEAIVFTSSATESNNTVLRHAALRAPHHGDHIVTVGTEHPSVLEVLEELNQQGIRTTVLRVGRDGRVDPELFGEALVEGTLLASVMWANNETGVVQPVPELAKIAAERGVSFHTDAVQALGKIELDLAAHPIDFASFSAHKLGGPKGIGALYARPGSRFTALLRGGGQERRRRAGTENVPGIVGFGAACSVARAELGERSARLGGLRDALWAGLKKAVPEATWNGDPDHVLAHVLNVSFPGVDAEALVAALDVEDLAVASGAACHSGSTEPSHVLLAMGVDPELGAGALRFSLGATTSTEEIDRALVVLPPAIERVRKATRAERAARTEAARR